MRACVRVCVCVCVAGKHGHYADFPFSFSILEEYSLLPLAGPSSATYAAHFYAAAGWSEGQKSGNQVNYGRRLADKSERKGEKVGITGGLCYFNGPGGWCRAPAAGRPGPAGCFVGSVVTLLTRPVLTRTSLSGATNTSFSPFSFLCFLLHTHPGTPANSALFSMYVHTIDGPEKMPRSRASTCSFFDAGTQRIPLKGFHAGRLPESTTPVHFTHPRP